MEVLKDSKKESLAIKPYLILDTTSYFFAPLSLGSTMYSPSPMVYLSYSDDPCTSREPSPSLVPKKMMAQFIWTL